jgi:hypothetical protein
MIVAGLSLPGLKRVRRIGLKATATLALCVLLFAAVASAHHSFAMFDMAKNVTFEGTVAEYNWENPHTHIIVKVPDSAGKATAGTWDIEGGAVNIMAKQGWTRTTYKAGDPIKVVGHPMKDGSKAASLFYAILPDGKRLYHDIARPNADGSAPPPTQP